jgi:hypothetical protein
LTAVAAAAVFVGATLQSATGYLLARGASPDQTRDTLAAIFVALGSSAV